ncbi:hypothetical protein PENTCL1PPCAC_21291 [Pristionchus entomophagus]|uniref:DM13 domain-containing protein n=1 Tax=Pristionchus entomophagus TaxID=358040 RepID=A0AAV5TXX6_9BILA|nr:hypothetical protein PENTCL1PPCAC_21291 [Pristionchus entomophagus]
MPSLKIALLLVSLSFSEAKVEFNHSTLYGIRDFEGVDEVPLPNCDSGCLIFASTLGVAINTPDGMEPYYKNLIINDPVNDKNLSIAELAVQFEFGTLAKIPLNFTESGNYSILNLNAPEDTGTEVTVWVIERSKVLESDYEVYDALAMPSRAAAIPKDVVTIMSANQFRVMAQPGEPNSFTARLVGFDNALDENTDVYKTPINSKFDGFELHVDGPLISLVFANKKKVDLSADYKYSVVGIRDLSKPGFVSTSGYSFCNRLGGNQIHSARFVHSGDEIDFRSEPSNTEPPADIYKVYLDTYVDLDATHEIDIIDDYFGKNTSISALKGARKNTPVVIERIQVLSIRYLGLTAPQTFLIRHSGVIVEKATSPAPTTVPTTPKITVPPTSSTKVTSTTITPTTSASGAMTTLAATAIVAVMMLAS